MLQNLKEIICFSSVQSVNSSFVQVDQNMEKVTIMFTIDENVVHVVPAGVNFSSNCTESVTFDYTNPVLITIPNTQSRLKTGQCQYSIQLVDSNWTQIGYPITGYYSMLIQVNPSGKR